MERVALVSTSFLLLLVRHLLLLAWHLLLLASLLLLMKSFSAFSGVFVFQTEAAPP